MPRKKKNDMVVKPIITGIHPQQKKMLRLHFHPDGIKASLQELKDMAEEEPLRFLFEDCLTLVNWALARLPLVPPTKEENEKTIQHEECADDREASCTGKEDKGDSERVGCQSS